jgi:hypothetical protein
MASLPKKAKMSHNNKTRTKLSILSYINNNMPSTKENSPTVATVFTSSLPKRYLSVSSLDIFHPAHSHMININGPQKDPMINKQDIKYITTKSPIS